MRVLIQRVLKGKVTVNPALLEQSAHTRDFSLVDKPQFSDQKGGVNDNVIGEIDEGFVIFLGVGENDSQDDCENLAEKIANIRIFSNEQGKFDKSLRDIRGQALVVSQFTLYADTKKGRRPDFTKAAKPETAEKLYNYFVQCLKNTGIDTKTGMFAAEMKVEIINDGPVTIWLDTEQGVG